MALLSESQKGGKKETASLLEILRGARVTTKHLRCDIAVKNMEGLRELCQANGIKIGFAK